VLCVPDGFDIVLEGGLLLGFVSDFGIGLVKGLLAGIAVDCLLRYLCGLLVFFADVIYCGSWDVMLLGIGDVFEVGLVVCLLLICFGDFYVVID
jgi:hypothetical protein